MRRAVEGIEREAFGRLEIGPGNAWQQFVRRVADWLDVPVPPAIEPGTAGGGLDRNTIVFFG
jgi:hypothetical protein